MSELVLHQRIVLTIQPSDAHAGKLRADEAMRQVLDVLAVIDDTAQLSAPEAEINWILDSATTNSPFTVTVVAESARGIEAIDAQLSEIKLRAAMTIETAMLGHIPEWLSPNGASAMRDVIRRTANGIALTKVDFGGGVGAIDITHDAALEIVDALPMRPSDVTSEIPKRMGFGEISGVLAAVGHYYRRPALHLKTTLYGNVWCVLSDALVNEWGGDTRLATVWQGRRLTVYGRLTYLRGGRLMKVDVETVREHVAPPFDIRSVFDPDFTAGLDPVEYLERLHEGQLG